MGFKNFKVQRSFVLLTFLLFCSFMSRTQILPSLIINNINTQFSQVSLPYWLNAGQSINLGTNAKSVSIVEFTLNGSNLEFSQAIVLTTAQTVPSNKVWKIEAIGLNPINTSLPSTNLTGSSSGSSVTSLPTIFQSPKKFETPGTYNWTVPPGVNSICIEAWGGGGGGSFYLSWLSPGLGGGGGGYAYQCFSVSPGTTYTVVVGAGGNSATETVASASSGGTSSVSGLITVSGGAGGTAGGQGGGSTNTFNVTGNSGTISKGGNGANGGNGGIETSSANSIGAIPGGAGSSINQTYPAGSGSGGRGQVYIYW